MNQNDHTKLKEYLKELFLNNPYKIKMTSFGCKQTNGVLSNEVCIRFGVVTKIPLDQIPEEQRIPKTITFDGIEYKTDVHIVPEKFVTGDCLRRIQDDVSDTHTEDFYIQAENVLAPPCHNTGSNSVPPVTIPPVSHNRATTRPLRGGVSMSAPPPTGFVNAGTLGVIVVDNLDGKLVGLTNNHVCTKPGGSGTQKCQFFANDGFHSSSYEKYDVINIYQQSSWDSGVVNKSEDIIGIKKRAVPFTTAGPNFVDAGIVNLSNAILDTESWRALGSGFGATPPVFATTEEIDALAYAPETPIFKSGRTTGPVGPDVYTSCIMRVAGINGSSDVSGVSSVAPTAILFTDLIALESDTAMVGKGGDSGSGVYAKIGGVWKLIGLYFAGGSGTFGLACRIDRIASLLHISPYTGGTVDADPNPRTYISLPAGTYASQMSASIDGKIYWQVGYNQTPGELSLGNQMRLNFSEGCASITYAGKTYFSQNTGSVFPYEIYEIDCTAAPNYAFSYWSSSGNFLWDQPESSKTNAFMHTQYGPHTLNPIFVLV